MSDVSPATAKPKAKPGVVTPPPFENAFAGATIEAPAAFRDFAEKGISHAKESYEKMKSAAEETNSLLEKTCSSASKGVTDYGLKVIEAARINANATFDYAAELVAAKSPSDIAELATTHARKRFETWTAQMHELTDLAHKAASDTTETFRDGITRVVKTVA
jgi:phasin